MKTAIVSKLPNCDMCAAEGKIEPADYDAAILGGGWANLCQPHFDACGCTLGEGRGQKLVLECPELQPRKDQADKLCEQCGKVCADDCWNKTSGRFRILDNPVKIEAMIEMDLYCEEVW